MGFLAQTYQWIGQTFRLTDVEPWRLYAKNVGVAPSGTAYRPVTIEGALALTVVFACIRLLSDTIANLPVDVYQRLGKGRSEERPEHPVARLFAMRPNAYMTSLQFVQLMQSQLEGWGNAFAQIQRGVRGDLVGLLPLRSCGMRLNYPTQSVWPEGYEYTDERGQRTIYGFDEILHLRGMGGGLWGLSPIAAGRLAVSGAMAAEEYGARMYAKGMRKAGYLTIEQVLTPDQRVQVRKAIIEPMESPDTTTALLEAGMKFESVSLSPEDAQYIETRKWQTLDLLRMFGVQPHLVGDLEGAAYGNTEDQGIDFVRYAVNFRVGQWQSEIKAKLFSDAEQRDHYMKFNLNALMAGNATARASFYNVMVRNGLMSVNECRAKEDLPPVEGGDEMRVQAQMTPLTDAGQQPDPGQPAQVPPPRKMPPNGGPKR